MLVAFIFKFLFLEDRRYFLKIRELIFTHRYTCKLLVLYSIIWYLFDSGSGSNSSVNSMQSAVQMAMNAAVRASMSSMVDGLGGGHHQQSGHQSMLHHHQQSNHDQNSPTLRMQEAILRSQAEAALRLAVTQAVAASSGQQQQSPEHNRQPAAVQQQNAHQTQQSAALNYNAMAQGQLMNGQNPYHHQSQVSPDLSEALRLQEQRLEQALRLHGGDPRALGFTFGNAQQGHNINP